MNEEMNSRPPRAARAWWLLAGSVMSLGLIGYGALSVVQLLAHETRTVHSTHDVDGVRVVALDHDYGRVEVVGADVDVITVDARVSRGLADTTYSVEQVDDRLVIYDNCPQFQSFWCSVDYEITVPADMALDLDSDNGGVSVRDITADVVIGADNGRIDLESVTGNLRIDSDNGRIVGRLLGAPTIVAATDNGRIDLESAVAPTSVVVSSSNGRIRLVLPDVDEGYAVSTTTRNGGVTVDVVSNPRSSRVVSATSSNGSIRILPPASPG